MDKFKDDDSEDIRNCEELWDLSNGECLCEKCHKKIHNKIKYGKKNEGDGWKLVRR